MQDSDWLFDMILDLCNKADDLGLKGTSAKLEEALDAFLLDMGHAVEPRIVSDVSFAAIGPISLYPDSFVLGNRRVGQAPTAEKAVYSAPRRTAPSVALQALLAARAKSKDEDEDEPTELMSRAS